MSEKEQVEYPYVLVDRAESEFFLNDYIKVMEDTDKALSSQHLTDYERLECGLKRIAVHMQLDQEDEAVEEYKKYIIGCPLFPKYDYFQEKIIIRNLPDCNLYKNFTKERMIAQYCKGEEDIHEYGNTWIINRTKLYNDDLNDRQNKELEVRTSQQIEACVNSCNTLAVAADFCCYILPAPPILGGPITTTACRFACVALVERLRQDCENCCYNTDKSCANKTFESWKQRFIDENPRCGKPPFRCK